ncbi:MAG: hypothetical protein KOO61_08375 [Spirochaetales bacterium]|nr:hypothetical protein [Spirochaetales bacterium]
MNRLIRAFAGLILSLTITSAVGAEPGFQSITLLFSETWTGNAYHLYNEATGSEGVPIDPTAGGGARFNLVDPFLFESGALTVDPRLVVGARRYLLYPSGWVVPTQLETSLGGTENLEPGLGSARVLALTIAAPVGLEIGLGESAALTVGLSPTVVFRIRAGDADYLNDISDLNAMYPFFYGRLRWLRPELHLAGRFDLSEYLSFAIRATSSISILDLADATLPWWDQLQVAGTFELSATPPLSGLFRNPDDPDA